MKTYILISIVGISVASFLTGILEESLHEGCTYSRIMSRFNPPFIIGCQLVKKRW